MNDALSIGHSDNPDRQLWAAVVLQAAEDIDCEDYGSTNFEQSVCFFLHDGDWAAWRGHVAAMINLHADDLTRLGRTRIAARASREPPPPPRPRPIPTPRAKPSPMPKPTLAQPIAREWVTRTWSPPRPPVTRRPKVAKDWRDARSNAWLVTLLESCRQVSSGD